MKPLQEYDRKRDFKKTSEPAAKIGKLKSKKLSFVVQEHHASHLHYDFRLELDGVLKSWAVPKGPSPDPKEKRLAMEVEDHPLAYGKFEGMIPEGEYGGGEVFIWDAGTWEPTLEPHQGLKKGHLDFVLKGKRMKGAWTLIRTGQNGKPAWLLFKRSDEFAGDKSNFKAIQEYGSKKEAPTAIKKKLQSIAKMTKAASSKKLVFIEPELPLLVERPPVGKEWVHEMKFDGYRIQAHLQNGTVKLYTRSGQDWTEKYSGIADQLKKLSVDNAILDGEIVALDAEGKSDFQELQLAMKNKKTALLKYYVFDLLFCDDEDFRPRPLSERKKKLTTVIPKKSVQIKLSEHISTSGSEMLGVSCEHDLEGIVSKDIRSLYVSGRTSYWMKSKCTKRQEFVIGGYSDPQGSRSHFGSLLLGIYEKGKLKYAGRCGTGFNGNSIAMVAAKLKKIGSKNSPFELKSPRENDIHWVKPELVAEIAFSNWTRDEILRVPVFHGLREDKAPTDVKHERETPVEKAQKVTSTKSNDFELGSLPKLTHPDKIIYAKEKITKQMVADYYTFAAKWILPQISNRLLSLMRCPDGTGKTCFYQKHLSPQQRGKGKNPAVHEVMIEESSGEKPYPMVDSAAGLVTLVQSGAFEFHAWGCKQPDIEHPDQIVMDFDPSPEVKFVEVKRAALKLKETLDHLHLKSYVKVTGGKGLHVHIPFAPDYSWDQIKEFAQVLARQMAEEEPEKYVAVMSKEKRKGKIFVDYLRNGRGSTAVAPYSLRAKAVSTVAMPVAWEELKAIKDPAMFTLKKSIEFLKNRKTDPWKGISKNAQKISLIQV